MQGVQIYSEIGKLSRALVHRPGIETCNYAEDDFEQVFSLRKWTKRFDIDKALDEHRRLVSLFERHDVEVLDVRDLLIEALDADPNARQELVESYVSECGVRGAELLGAVKTQLEKATNSSDLANTIIGGVHYGETELCHHGRRTLASLTQDAFEEKALLVNPLNTLFFTRDPATPIGRGVLLNHLYWHERDREVGVYRCILRHHPLFATVPLWDQQKSSFHIEGGDILNLDRHTIAVGVSERTEASAIDTLANNLFWGSPASEASEVQGICVIRVPSDGLRIHLDTYINRVDRDAFIVDPAICEAPEMYRIERGARRGVYRVTSLDMSLAKALSFILGGPVRLIPCGGSDTAATLSERLGNATSVLALEPGTLCVLEQNHSTNEALYKAGMALEPIAIEELTKGYGGPNCLCLPLWRSEI